MTQFICPSCGSKYFLASRVGPKNVFNVGGERMVKFVQLTSNELVDVDLDTQNMYCGACSWQGSLSELVESHTA